MMMSRGGGSGSQGRGQSRSGRSGGARGGGRSGGHGLTSKGDGGIRIARVEREVQSLISQFLAGSYKGDLPGIVTVSHVKMPADLRTAQVAVSFLNASPDAEKEGVRILQRRAPEIQHYINGRMPMKYCPRLTFEVDKTTERLLKIDQMLRDIDGNLGKIDNEPENEPSDDSDDESDL